MLRGFKPQRSTVQYGQELNVEFRSRSNRTKGFLVLEHANSGHNVFFFGGGSSYRFCNGVKVLDLRVVSAQG